MVLLRQVLASLASGAALASVSPTALRAQAAEPADTARFRQAQIARAEAEGAAFAALPATGSAHPILVPFAGEPAPPQGSGTVERRCIEAGSGMGPFRSGEWVIGGGPFPLLAGVPNKVWWAPLHQSKEMPPLLLSARSLVPPADSFAFTTAEVAFSLPRDIRQPVPVAERRHFFPSGFTPPRAGRWVMTVASGANWGCFLVTVAAVRPRPR